MGQEGSSPNRERCGYHLLGPGVDWGKIVEGAPSGRPFYYVDPFVGSDVIIDVDDIKELFV